MFWTRWLRWLEIVWFFGTRRLGANCANHFKNLWLQNILFPHIKAKIMTQTLGKHLKYPFPFMKNIHIPFMCSFRNAYLAHTQMVILWIFLQFSMYVFNSSQWCYYFWLQGISVNRKPNKWLNRRNRIFSKMCWQDFMKYIHFVALHIQNNCAKFQRILPKEYG